MMQWILNRVLRRTSVRWRIVGGFMLILAVAGAVASIILFNLNSLVARTEEFTTVDAQIERLLLLASRRVTTSQVNLNRYIQGLVPIPSAARDDVVLALINLKQAQAITTDPDRVNEIALIIESLEQYQRNIDNLQAAHTTGKEAEVKRLEADLQQLGSDISARLEQTATNNARDVATKTDEVLNDARRYISTSVALLGFGFLLAFLLAALISFSVTQPLTEFHASAESFQQGAMLAKIPEEGEDELTTFARVFNALGTQISELVTNLERRVAERTDELARRTSQLHASSQVARQAAAIKDPTLLINDAVRMISDSFGFYHAALFLLDEHGQYAILQAASSEGGQRMLARGHRLQVGSQGLVGYAAAQKRPRIALDTGADAVYFDNPDLPTTRSEAALPLVARNRVIGVLDIQSEKPNAFVQEDIDIFQTLADQLALAFENARLFNEMEASMNQLEQLSAQQVRQRWLETSEADMPAVQYTPLGIQNVSRKTLEPPDPQTLMAPIALHNQQIGTIRIKRKMEGNVWSKRDREMLDEIAAQVGLALENARLLSDAQRRAVHERVIGEVTARIGAAFDVDTVLRTAAQEIGKALGDAEVSVHLEKDGNVR
ncbi:MAG: GAF domain-containing protein [Chloroflexota bacterium]